MVKDVVFHDRRFIKADDYALSLLLNKMAQKRLVSHQKRLEKVIDNNDQN